MAIRTQLTALVLLTSSALYACTAGSAGDGSSAPTAPAAGHDSPVSSVQDATKHRGRPHMPISAGRLTTTASVAKLLEADGGTEEDAGGGSSSGGSSSGGPSYQATVTTNKASYTYGEAITISFSNMSTNNPNNWVGIARQGSPNTMYSSYAYTDVAAAGDAAALADLPPGMYVARAYFGDDYTIRGESTAFEVLAPSPAPGSTVTVANGAGGTNEQFGGFENIAVSFTGLTANTAFDVGVFYEYGSNSLPYTTISGTANESGAGSAELTDLLSGVTYDVRVFQGGSWKLQSSTRFRVNPAVRATKSSFGPSDQVEIEFAGMEGLSFVDKVQLATAGGAVVQTKNADWYWSGTLTFDRPAAGSYVAKIFNGVNDTATAQATSTAFEIQ